MKKNILILKILLILIISANVNAADKLPGFTGYVNDNAGILDQASIQKTTALISELEQKTTAQIAVLIVNSIQSDYIEDYAVSVFEKWGIGQKGKDNGILLVVAVKERKIRIETGYGIEHIVTDSIANEIIGSIIRPSFRNNNYGAGIYIAVSSMANLIANEYNVQLSSTGDTPPIHYQKRSRRASNPLRTIISIIIFFLVFGRFGLFMFPLFFGGRGYWSGRSGSGGFWSGGSGGGFGSGGFGGFGGGMSGGGGASGGW